SMGLSERLVGRVRRRCPPAHSAQWAGLSPQKHPSFLGISRVQLQLSGKPPIPARARLRQGPHSWPTPSLPCPLAGHRKASTATCPDSKCPRPPDRSGGGQQARPNRGHYAARSGGKTGVLDPGRGCAYVRSRSSRQADQTSEGHDRLPPARPSPISSSSGSHGEMDRGKGRGPVLGIRPENDRLLAELLCLDASALQLIVEGLAANAVTCAKLAHRKCLSSREIHICLHFG